MPRGPCHRSIGSAWFPYIAGWGLPEDPTRRYTETTHSQSTDDKGHAAFKDVPPGNYLLFAWEKVEQGAWFDLAFLKAAASEATKVTIGPKDSQHVEVKLIPVSK